jgi:hypothetical protein
MKKYFLLLLVVIFFSGCVSDKQEGAVVSDASLFGLATSVSAFSYYKNSPDTLDADPASPHFAFVRVKFNPRATASLNVSLSGLSAASFPDESLIVKEVYDTRGGGLQVYAVMLKMRGAGNNGDGWIWGEYRADGTVIYSAARKGDQCVGCHRLPGAVDLVRTFALH